MVKVAAGVDFQGKIEVFCCAKLLDMSMDKHFPKLVGV